MFVESSRVTVRGSRCHLRLARAFFVGALALVFAGQTRGQITFQNLDFEQGKAVPVRSKDDDDNLVKESAALPGWTVYYGNKAQSSIEYNDFELTKANVSWLTTSFHPSAPQGLAHGQHYLLLQEGSCGSSDPGDPSPWEMVSIAQTGTIPTSAKTLTFSASLSQLDVTFDGVDLPMQVVSAHNGYDVFGCDISAFSGQTGQLEFTAGDHYTYLDNIGFSSSLLAQPAPEPQVGIYAVGVGLLWWTWAKRRR